MANTKRLFLTMSEDEWESFERAREELGMNRSQFVRYLIGGQKEIRPSAIKYKELIFHIANIDRDLKVIAMKEELSDLEKMQVLTKLEDLKKLLGKGEV